MLTGDIYGPIVSSGGITPSGEIEITENGTYDVTEKASAVVNVSEGTQEYFLDFNPINASPEKYIYCYVTLNGEEI